MAVAPVTFQDNYVHIDHRGLGAARTEDVALDGLLRAMELCAEHRCFRILIEADEPLRHASKDTVDRFAQRLCYFPGLKVAISIPDPERTELMNYYVSVARQHGTTIEYFAQRESGLEWLGAK